MLTWMVWMMFVLVLLTVANFSAALSTMSANISLASSTKSSSRKDLVAVLGRVLIKVESVSSDWGGTLMDEVALPAFEALVGFESLA